MRMEGLEPTRLAAPDPKSGAATNYATSAWTFSKGEAKVCSAMDISKYFDRNLSIISYPVHFLAHIVSFG